MVLAGEKNASNGEVFNIAAGKPITILDLAETIIELCGKNIEPVFEADREFEIRHRFADVSKMRTILKYKPKVELKNGLNLTIEWYKQNLMKWLVIMKIAVFIHCYYLIPNSLGYSTIPDFSARAPTFNSIAINASSGTLNGHLIFHLDALSNPNLG